MSERMWEELQQTRSDRDAVIADRRRIISERDELRRRLDIAANERDRLRRGLEALRDELRNGPGFRAVTLDAIALERRTADRLDAILRGES